MLNKRSALFVIPPLAVCSVALAAAGHTVFYNDQVLTQNARQIDGQTYVPLSDVARVLNGRVTSGGGRLEIVTGGASGDSDGGRTAAGGANEVRGANGKVGDWFFNGYWRFRVNSVQRTDSMYQFQYSGVTDSDKPKGDNNELVVVNCTIKNGQKTADLPTLTAYGLSSQETALTDDQGQSYPPIDFDARGGSLASGAAKNFAIVFSVPKGTNLKDLIFTIYSSGNFGKSSNVRVSLAGQ
jgi:hypothetical protein